MILKLLGFGRPSNAIVIDAIYGDIVAAARQPRFYRDMEVPDTPLGRYEMLSLHMFLLMHDARVRRDPAVDAIVQDVTEQFFQDVDHSLRELGIGDTGVPKRMKKLAKMFYGRCESYGSALLAQDDDALMQALARNIWPDVAADQPPAAVADLAGYVTDAFAAIAQAATGDILKAAPRFAALATLPASPQR
jgi:cytochrome b pre-mRNA-processing protein 3